MDEKESNKKPLSMVERMKLKSKSGTKYGGEFKPEKASIGVTDCPNCGAGRAKMDGVRRCAYCDFEFLENNHTAGIHLNYEKDKGEL